MKTTSSTKKTTQRKPHQIAQRASAGPDGLAISPPARSQGLAHTSQAVMQTKKADSENRTGLPDVLKSGVESLSGLAVDDVRVHYNSSKPAELQALAYTQGTDIHVAPGQERHLPHEAWHVVQQKQGRVQPTTQVAGEAVNDSQPLEREADNMGSKSLKMNAHAGDRQNVGMSHPAHQVPAQRVSLKKGAPIQAKPFHPDDEPDPEPPPAPLPLPPRELPEAPAPVPQPPGLKKRG